jgi:peptidoglycan hydrolase CwlO-like protein
MKRARKYLFFSLITCLISHAILYGVDTAATKTIQNQIDQLTEELTRLRKLSIESKAPLMNAFFELQEKIDTKEKNDPVIAQLLAKKDALTIGLSQDDMEDPNVIKAVDDLDKQINRIEAEWPEQKELQKLWNTLEAQSRTVQQQVSSITKKIRELNNSGNE